ncbi:bifunctional diguanylate cyclase/phosphodiesterase [Natronosporangium hydrolyticum]|uniref:Bifunctional diguanylate cyclase/phosphodiesterase n=1 Tax=Natronosporangium hydrolyticum TaxID=2811111 RepID=A0A895YJJ1_9ACTN|nr:bifunctional diguanylate cyclase/phosphodiesterase [Natronosporangium hydrolyticum]QSB13948.1 bifunctional diguanylate cyclase/phosphodiesterase [Natronosporangium hydrolyticum]
MTLARNLILAVALVTLLGGLWVAAESPPWWRLMLAIGVAAATHLLRQRLRVGPAVFYLAWGEAALVISLFLVPAGWVPLAVLCGAMVAVAGRALHFRRRPPETVPEVAGVLTIAAGVGSLIAVSISDPYASGLSGPVALGLVLAALGYVVTVTGLAHLMLRLRRGVSAGLLLRRTLVYKLTMLLGSLAVALPVAALARAEWRWLLVLPLALWLLHWSYTYRIRSRERRRMWARLAAATRSLNLSDEAAVAAAGARGALEVFAVGRAEVQLSRGTAGAQAWVADTRGVRPRDALPDPETRVCTAVPLLAAGQEVGVLRIYFPEQAGPGNGEYTALRVYADALAAALQDTATHEELHRLLERSVYDAQHDRLTGLLNRAALLARGETAVQLSPHGSPVALLLVDVDHFREINDTLGHAAGDQVLTVTAARMREHAQPGELLGRLGGDEFALLVPVPGRAALSEVQQSAVERGRELVRRLAAEADINGVTVAVESSVGVVVAPAGTADMAELLRRADAAVRQAKQGGGTVGWYDPRQDASSPDRPALLAELRAALDRNDELVLALQPVIELATGAPIGVEALARWRHPQRGLLPPAEFLRAVENSDLLGLFTEYVIDRALAVAAQWARRGSPLPVAVNLSARSLLDTRLPRVVSALLRKHRLPGRLLVVEITETVITSEQPGVLEALRNVRALGVRLSVDDFGTGYASLTLLTQVPLDEVKLDGEFVARAAESVEAAAIVRTTVELGREIGIRVVAEGVETEPQRTLLTRLGCTAGQGFHLAAPTGAEQIGELLRSLSAGAKRQRSSPAQTA